MFKHIRMLLFNVPCLLLNRGLGGVEGIGKTGAISAVMAIFIVFALPAIVRAGAVDLPRTGQTTCYNSSGYVIVCLGTGQDGDIQAGVPWSSPRFTNNNDGTVTDNLTGLMWTQDGNAPGPPACSHGSTKLWQDALNYVACLNTNGYLGYTDWRLPNVNELESLINAEQPNSSTWLNTQGFSNVWSGYYWSSTSYVYYPSSAWIVYMWNNSYMDFKGKYNYYYNYYVWPVRGGQVAPLAHSITGTVMENSIGLSGVTMTLGGDTSATTTTTSEGTYSFAYLTRLSLFEGIESKKSL